MELTELHSTHASSNDEKRACQHSDTSSADDRTGLRAEPEPSPRARSTQWSEPPAPKAASGVQSAGMQARQSRARDRRLQAHRPDRGNAAQVGADLNAAELELAQ